MYAVEASGMAETAKQIVDINHLSDVITVLQCRVEDVSVDEHLNGERVDIIISEWRECVCEVT